MIIYIYFKKLNIKPKPLRIILYDTKINIFGVVFEVMGEVQGHKVNYSPVSCLRLLLELVLSVSGYFSNLLTRHSNAVRSICYNGTTQCLLCILSELMNGLVVAILSSEGGREGGGGEREREGGFAYENAYEDSITIFIYCFYPKYK